MDTGKLSLVLSNSLLTGYKAHYREQENINRIKIYCWCCRTNNCCCCFNFRISGLFIIDCTRSGNVDTWQYISVLNVRIIIIIFMAIEKIILISSTKQSIELLIILLQFQLHIYSSSSAFRENTTQISLESTPMTRLLHLKDLGSGSVIGAVCCVFWI